MSDYFKVKRPGLISTFQDLGRKNFYHIGLPFSGVMDKRNYLLLNKIFSSKHNWEFVDSNLNPIF